MSLITIPYAAAATAKVSLSTANYRSGVDPTAAAEGQRLLAELVSAMTDFEVAAGSYNTFESSGAHAAAIASLADVVAGANVLSTSFGHALSGADNFAKAADGISYFAAAGAHPEPHIVAALQRALDAANASVAVPSTAAQDAIIAKVNDYVVFANAT